MIWPLVEWLVVYMDKLILRGSLEELVTGMN